MPDNSIKLTAIEVRDRFRKDMGDIESLKESIKKHGVIEPLVVSPLKRGKFLLISGERRLRACQELKINPPVVLREDLGELERRELELEENIQRKDFTWQEQVEAVAELHRLKESTHGEKVIGRPAKGEKEERGWGVEDTATALDESAGKVSQDILLATAIKLFPELAEEKTKTGALQKYKKLRQKAVEILLRQKAKGLVKKPQVFCTDGIRYLEEEMKPESVDYIVVDPPWGIAIDNSSLENRGAWKDSEVMGDIFEDSPEKALKDIERLLTACYRVLRTNRHMTLFVGEQHMNYVQELARKLFKVQNPLGIWVKDYFARPAVYWLSMQHEVFLQLAKGERKLNAVHGTTFAVPRVAGTMKIHPTEKPVQLLEQLIELYTLPGETVLDPMMGSGSALVAALQLDRLAIGCEINKKYFEAALPRLYMVMQEKEPKSGETK